MSEDLIMFLALDELLKALDFEYKELPDEVIDMATTRIYEAYGMSIKADQDEVDLMRAKILEDVYAYRASLLKSL